MTRLAPHSKMPWKSHWDYFLDYAHREDIQSRGPRTHLDQGVGTPTEQAFKKGRLAFKSGTTRNPYEYNKKLTKAFRSGWIWQKNHGPKGQATPPAALKDGRRWLRSIWKHYDHLNQDQ